MIDPDRGQVVAGAKVIRHDRPAAVPRVDALADPALKPAREKLERLAARATDLRAEGRGLTQASEDLRSRQAETRRWLSELQSHTTTSRAAADDDPRVENARAETARLQGDFDRTSGISKAKAEERSAIEHLIQSARNNIAKIPAGAIKLAPKSEAEPLAGETVRKAVDATRQQIAQVHAHRYDARTAWRKAADAKADARREIEALADAGAVDVTGLIERGGTLSFPTHHVRAVPLGTTDLVGLELPNTLAIFAWLHKDALIAAVERQIDKQADDAVALTDDERIARLVQLDAELLELERREERLIEVASASGEEIVRRQDVDYRALLGLADDMPAPGERRRMGHG